MTFKTALDFHMNFTMKMTSYCKNPDHSLDPEEVVKADLCALGQWLESEKPIHGQVPEFSQVEMAHVEFHKAAAAVVRKVNSGFDGRGDVAFGSQSVYGKASSVLTNLLHLLGTKLG